LPLLAFPLNLDSVNATRYENTTHGNTVKWLYRPATSVENRTILIIDDILDQGITLAAIKDDCMKRGAKKIYSAVLVNKLTGENKPIQADFIGVNAENRYLFGYGMDYKGYLRNAPGLFACNVG
jgi:hypoxanthine phosphoribosyltransferase